MNQKASLQVGHDGVAVITLQNPPVNALHPAGVLHVCSVPVVCFWNSYILIMLSNDKPRVKKHMPHCPAA